MEEYKEWMKRAEQDSETAEYNLKGGKLEAAAFFMQQAAEKALKAVHIKKFGTFPKIHDLVVLANKVSAPKEIVSYAKLLTPAYLYTRYPDYIKKEELIAKIEDLTKYCEEILKWTKKNL